MTASDDIGAWFDRFWAPDDEESANSIEEITAVEETLGVKLPAVLRAAYMRSWLRRSWQMHLRPLEELQLARDALVFMDGQQQCSAWGCRVGDGADDNPPALATMDPGDPSWEEEGISTLALLKLFHLTNRPCESPFVMDVGLPNGPELLRLGWDEYVFPLRFGPASFWVKGSVVANNVALGARTRAELEQALRDLGAVNSIEDIV